MILVHLLGLFHDLNFAVRSRTPAGGISGIVCTVPGRLDLGTRPRAHAERGTIDDTSPRVLRRHLVGM